jgi:hypothetical protein
MGHHGCRVMAVASMVHRFFIDQRVCCALVAYVMAKQNAHTPNNLPNRTNSHSMPVVLGSSRVLCLEGEGLCLWRKLGEGIENRSLPVAWYLRLN